MGTFRHPVEVGDPVGERFERIEALVDTGATYTVVPASLLERLGVEPIRRSPFSLADGRLVEKDVGQTWLQVDGQRIITPVVFGAEGEEPLLGAVTLESLLLSVDPVGQQLVPVPGLMMTLKRGELE